MPYKTQYIIMHLVQRKHTLPNLSTNLSVHVVKRLQQNVGSKISFTFTCYFMYFLYIAMMKL